MRVRIASDRIEVQAPAKINLFLEVLARRADGYHEIETHMTPVGVYDTLSLEATSGPEIRLNSRWAAGLRAGASGGEAGLGDLPPAEKNIVYKAASLLQERSGCAQGAEIRLVKRIPSAAGLGGASSDAAAALVAANLAWGLGWTDEQLLRLAAELGSDIPFFLGRASAICRGRGEQIEPIGPVHMHIVVARPPTGLSTPQVYRACRPAEQPARLSDLQAGLGKGSWSQVKLSLVNRLEEPARQLTPWIARLRRELDQAGSLAGQMSGSGSSCFGICHSRRHARRTASRLRSRNVGMVMATTTLG